MKQFLIKFLVCNCNEKKKKPSYHSIYPVKNVIRFLLFSSYLLAHSWRYPILIFLLFFIFLFLHPQFCHSSHFSRFLIQRYISKIIAPVLKGQLTSHYIFVTSTAINTSKVCNCPRFLKDLRPVLNNVTSLPIKRSIKFLHNFTTKGQSGRVFILFTSCLF